jgi:pyruvate/2-oxoglutarate/acetoin dehydrogenase E1 component
MGGRRGYGPTHSQSIESIFFGIPGLEVVAPSPLHPVGELLCNSVLRTDNPTLFVENKLMYPQSLLLPEDSDRVGNFAFRIKDGLYPTVHLSIDEFKTCDLVMIVYGSSVNLAMSAAEQLLLQQEIACDILIPSQLAPVPIVDFIEPVIQAGRALIIEEGVRTWGWGSEIASLLYENVGSSLVGGSVSRIGARSFPVPVSRPLENSVLPQLKDIVDAALKLF